MIRALNDWLEALVVLWLLRIKCWLERYTDPARFLRLQNPETEELRAIYREIDVAAGIDDPELATPAQSETLKGDKYAVVAGAVNFDGRTVVNPRSGAARPGSGWMFSVPPKAEKRGGAPGPIGGFKSPAGGGGRRQGKDRP